MHASTRSAPRSASFPALVRRVHATHAGHTLRALVAILALSTLASLTAGCRHADVEPGRLSLDEVEARLGQPDVHLFDANPREMYDAKHVPGARWVQWDHVTLDDLPKDRDATLIFYCAVEACSASGASAKAAIRLGYPHVFVMPGGILGWKKAGKPIEKSPSKES